MTLKTKKNKLKHDLEFILKQKYPSNLELSLLIAVYEEYQKNNLDEIKRLNRKRLIDSRRISGAIKSTIKVHGPITMNLIGSATKRILGSLLTTELIKKENIIKKLIKKWIN
jgi:hypothetical protein